MSDGVEDLVGGLGPHERLGVLVPFVDPAADVAFQVDDGVVCGTAEFAGGQFGEPALDEVEPGRRGRGEVQVEAWVAQLQQSIQAWIDTWNQDPRPFVWTKTADEILDTIATYCQRINDSGH